MAVPASSTYVGRRLSQRAIADDSAELVRREIGGRIVQIDPPFAHARQMVIRGEAGDERRVAFDLELLALQRAADLRLSAHWPARRAAQ